LLLTGKASGCFTVATRRHGKVRIGISGWLYRGWRGTFYPPDLPQKDELAFVGRSFNSVEVNSTFYRSQAPNTFKRWAATVPDDFVFAVKGSRYITHIRRLRDAKEPLANFFATGVLGLGKKLGPILWQLPPNFRFQPDVIESFLDLLPQDTAAASKLAKKHGPRSKPSSTVTDAKRPLRHALEIRHDSFIDPAFIELLRAHNVALVCADTVEWPRLMDLTADFVYCRLHGASKLYFTNYSPRDINAWAKRVQAWINGDAASGKYVVKDAKVPRIPRDVYVYFDNTEKVHAPDNAKSLARKVMKST
jgi:uncharacterized protein YecE (DUF72 family)